MKKRSLLNLSNISTFIIMCLGIHIAQARVTETDAQPNPASVWKISKTINAQEQVVYLGGTIHLLRESDYPLPEQYEKAYSQSDEIFFEVDLQEANSQQAQNKLLQGIMLPNGESIQDKISKDNFEKVAAYVKKLGMPLDQAKQFTPEGLSLILSSQAILELGFTPQGVDQFYDQQAKKDGKKRGFLETLDEQLSFLTNMKADANMIMEYTFRDINNLQNIMDEMISAWREGKEITSVTKDMKMEFPNIYDALIVTRNKNWIPILEQQFLDAEIEFVLVGAGHLTGEDSVLQMLKAKGYLVEQL